VQTHPDSSHVATVSDLEAPTPAGTKLSTGKRIVLTTFGSFGDLHPYMAIALELQARGHHLVIATSRVYQQKIEDAGIEFAPVRPDLPDPTKDEGMAEMTAKVMDGKNGSEYLFTHIMMPPLRDSYADLKRAVQEADLLVTHVITFAGPIIAQETGIKWISTVLSPVSFWSAHDPSVLPNVPGQEFLPKLGPAAYRGFTRMAQWKSKQWIKEVYQLRRERGLPLGQHPLFEGQHAPDLVLALFSSVLAQPQPDWPPQTCQTGFCFYDRRDGNAMSPELRQFLESGVPPIVFTLGSAAVFDARNFFRDSIAAAQRVKQRAILLIGDQRNLPSEALPEGIVAFDYAPYSELLPHAAATVHQGGVGTTGQALRSGKPMLVMPFSHDQPDNAARSTRLGVGRTITRESYNATTAAAELSKILNDPAYAKKAAEVGRIVQAENGAQIAADAIERYLGVVKN